MWLYARAVSGPSKNRHARIIFLASAILLAPAIARAAPPVLETPPDVKDCPSSEDLRRVLASQIGRDEFDSPNAPRVVVRVRRVSEAELAADVSVTTSDGKTSTRTIEEADACGDLVRAAALTVALALEHDEKRAAEKRAEEPAPTPTPPPAVAEQAAPERSLRNDRGVVSLSALTAIGLLPRPAAGAGGSARVRISESLWASARGFYLPKGSMPNDEFALNLYGLGPGLCAEPFGSSKVAAVGCAHAIFGAYDVTRANALLKNAGAEAYVGASLFAGARARVAGPLHLEGGLDAQIPFVRPTYLTDACPPVGFEPPFTALALWLGAGLSIF